MKRAAIIIAALALTGCKTIEYRTVDTSCTSFRLVTFAALPVGQVDDPGNAYDTGETVKQLREHNVKWTVLCQSSS